jgi:DNA-binding NarL/FixJ family response regulator
MARKGSVFVADDSALVRAAVTRRIRDTGREVVEADSVKTAAGVDPASLVCALLDLDLGDGWGTDVAERLRASAPDLAIAFFTSEGGGDRVERAKTFGPVFAKPDDIDGAIAWVVSRA